MAVIRLGNLLWRSHTRPISPEDPVDVKDINTADIKAKLEMVQSELALVKAELQEIKANQLSGDQKVQLSGTITEEQMTRVTITAGATAVAIPGVVLGCNEVALRLAVSSSEGGGTPPVSVHMLPLNAAYGATANLRIPVPLVNDNENMSNFRTHTKMVKTVSYRAVFYISNGDSVDRSFDIWLVRKW